MSDEKKSRANGTLVIGITGGIASGKSTVARMVAAYGFPHLDADKIVHDLLQHDAATIEAIAAAFPEITLSPEGGGVNRAALAASITQQPERLATLEAILHPRVRAAEERFIAHAKEAGAKAVILDIPLLFETDAHTLCDKIIVTHAPLAHRKTRAFSRAGMTEEKWQRLLARQLPNHHEHPRADVVIDTGQGEDETRLHVKQLIQKWKLV